MKKYRVVQWANLPLVCEASGPGLKTYLDLPMITGCLGDHAAVR